MYDRLIWCFGPNNTDLTPFSLSQIVETAHRSIYFSESMCWVLQV